MPTPESRLLKVRSAPFLTQFYLAGLLSLGLWAGVLLGEAVEGRVVGVPAIHTQDQTGPAQQGACRKCEWALKVMGLLHRKGPLAGSEAAQVRGVSDKQAIRQVRKIFEKLAPQHFRQRRVAATPARHCSGVLAQEHCTVFD